MGGWDLMHEDSKKLLYHPHIVCQIKRSKNDNRVMYQANLIEDGQGNKILDPANPISVFWLKIEPSHIGKEGRSNRTHLFRDQHGVRNIVDSPRRQKRQSIQNHICSLKGTTSDFKD